DLTVVDNVQFWSRASGVRDGDLMGALDRMGVSKRLHSVPVERLSAGQKRRVAIAIVIASRPRLWLLDEPHAGLDQSGRGLLDSLLVDAAEAGATVVFASHELDRAEAVATRSLSFSGGLIVSDDE
ncbi:MAG: energy-coupling factor ABC transporter ATP-binding protein, partial [Actinomycetota bacterium]|nr:energy-coupling factor ABC transporter ATP-binding protein [Actinomycetota bacterium]